MAPQESQEFFLGVPVEHQQSILEGGYKAHCARIRASKTPRDALLAYERNHSRIAACLSFEPPVGVEWAEVSHGVHVYVSFLPADSLRHVHVERDMTMEFRLGDVFWAVDQDLVDSILQSGFEPRHRRSIPVALSPADAENRYRSRRRAARPRVLRVKLESAKAAGFHLCEHGRGFSLHMPPSARRVGPEFLELAAADTSDETPRPAPGDVSSSEVACDATVLAPATTEQKGKEVDRADAATTAGDETTAARTEGAEFPHMQQARIILLYLCSGMCADQKRWVQGRIIQGGCKCEDVQVQVRTGKLGLPEQIYLNDTRVLDFHHPDACQRDDVERLQQAHVQALHEALPGRLCNGNFSCMRDFLISTMRLNRKLRVESIKGRGTSLHARPDTAHDS